MSTSTISTTPRPSFADLGKNPPVWSMDHSREDIYELISAANEYGSGYWAQLIEDEVPENADTSWMSDPQDAVRWPQHAAALLGGSVTYGVLDDDLDLGHERYVLNEKSIARGLQLMRADHPRDFGDFVSGNADAITSDIFLQCCLLGGVKYR